MTYRLVFQGACVKYRAICFSVKKILIVLWIMTYSSYKQQRILYWHSQGLKAPAIRKRLLEENLVCSRVGIFKFIQKWIANGSVARKEGSGRPLKATVPVEEIVECQMQKDYETSAKQLNVILNESGHHLSKSTILRCRIRLGWNYRGTAYCQMIREQNKGKRLTWALENRNDNFYDVIWTDETTVQMETHRRFSCRKRTQRPRYKPRPKHPVKVHVWGGISWAGRTGVCIFEGKMNAPMYTKLLENALIPFIREYYPAGHRFQQDNDPKHTSRHASKFFEENNVLWWKTPPESPDLNPIENLWHELKEFIRRVIKPKTKQQLIDGIQEFWETVDISK